MEVDDDSASGFQPPQKKLSAHQERYFEKKRLKAEADALKAARRKVSKANKHAAKTQKKALSTQLKAVHQQVKVLEANRLAQTSETSAQEEVDEERLETTVLPQLPEAAIASFTFSLPTPESMQDGTTTNTI
mmetsp:Transcript_51780/g.85892  ORF Transcript_51780/g.85892 Transcript_51780/m.85892 type:complete len:132 (-) Transcript_51780:221-616(-)